MTTKFVVRKEGKVVGEFDGDSIVCSHGSVNVWMRDPLRQVAHIIGDEVWPKDECKYGESPMLKAGDRLIKKSIREVRTVMNIYRINGANIVYDVSGCATLLSASELLEEYGLLERIDSADGSPGPR